MNIAAPGASAVPFQRDITLRQGLGTGPVSVEPYRSKEYFEQECDQVFGRAWLCMGRVDQLPEPGTYFVKPVEVRKASVLVTRDKADKIQAFHNVCKHRGNLVVLDASGKRNRFSCAYHGWTYGNTGELIGVPDEDAFFSLDRKACGLTTIHTDVWEGWIFINFQATPEVSLKEFLGPYGEVFAGVPYTNVGQELVIEARLKCNWKLIADAFSEAYHVSAMHPGTLAPQFSHPTKNKFAAPVSGHVYGQHRAVSTYGNMEFVPHPDSKVEALASAMQTGGVLAADVNDEILKLREHPGVNPTKSEHWAADVTWIFPNFHIDYSMGGFWTHEYWPVSVNETRWIARIRIGEATSVRHRLQQEHYSARWGEIMLEDITNCERIQVGLGSGAMNEMQLQDGEFMIRHHMDVLHRWIKAATVAEAMAAG